MATTLVSPTEDEEEGLEMGGLSLTDLGFLVSGPALSEAFIAPYNPSAVYIRLAMAPRKRRMVCVRKSQGHAYLGTGCSLSQVHTQKAKRLADAFETFEFLT